MADLEVKAVEILDKLDSLVTQYTPDIIEGATSVVQISAVGDLVQGLFMTLGACFLVWLTYKSAMYFEKKKKEGAPYNSWEIGIFLSYIVGGFISFVLVTAGIGAILEIWNWVAIWNPKLALAHKVLGL